MTESEIVSVLNGVRLTIEGKRDLSKFNYKVRESEKYSFPWLPSLIDGSHLRARLLGCALSWEGIYHTQIRKEQCEKLLFEWADRYDRPIRIFEELNIDTSSELIQLVKETSDWAQLLKLVSTKKIHPITFCYIDSLTNASSKWTTLRWKISKQRFNSIKKVVDIPHSNVVKLSCYLTKRFEEYENE